MHKEYLQMKLLVRALDLSLVIRFMYQIWRMMLNY